MYTAESIREVEFTKTGMSGVKSSEVYTFVDEVANDFEALSKQNEELIEKLKVLADCIEEYRKNEDTVKTAILTAQKTADRVLADANERASAILEEKTKAAQEAEKTANQTAQKLITDAQNKSREMLDDATMRSKNMLSQAQEDAKKKQSEIDKMIGQQMLTYNYIKDEVKAFKERIVESYKVHLDSLSNVPAMSKTLEVYNEKEGQKSGAKADNINTSEKNDKAGENTSAE